MIITRASTPGQIGPGSNGNEGILNAPRIYGTVASPEDAIQCHTKEPFWRSILSFFRVYSQSTLRLANSTVLQFLINMSCNTRQPMSGIEFDLHKPVLIY